jgi:hypothetical protein
MGRVYAKEFLLPLASSSSRRDVSLFGWGSGFSAGKLF